MINFSQIKLVWCCWMLKKSKVDLIWRGDFVIKALGKEAYNKLYSLGQDLENEVKDFISKPGTGRWYRKGKTVWYQASLPGFPPTIKWGELKGSISHVVVIEGEKTFLYIGTTKDYGYWLEVGTKNMEARPWLEAILNKLAPGTKVYLSKEWKLV